MRLEVLSTREKDEIAQLFVSVFSAEPWNDDWSDATQLERYIDDLIGNKNSLTLGLRDGPALIGLAMGHIRHWYSGTEYYIDELCIHPQRQGQGMGSRFLSEIEAYLRRCDIRHLFLLTDQNVPAYRFYLQNGFTQLKENVAFVKTL